MTAPPGTCGRGFGSCGEASQRCTNNRKLPKVLRLKHAESISSGLVDTKPKHQARLRIMAMVDRDLVWTTRGHAVDAERTHPDLGRQRWTARPCFVPSPRSRGRMRASMRAMGFDTGAIAGLDVG